MNNDVEEALVEENMTEQEAPETETVEEILEDEENAESPLPDGHFQVETKLRFDQSVQTELLELFIEAERDNIYLYEQITRAKEDLDALRDEQEEAAHAAKAFGIAFEATQPRELRVQKELYGLYKQIEPHTRGHSLIKQLHKLSNELMELGWAIEWNRNGLAEGQQPNSFAATRGAHTIAVNASGAVYAYNIQTIPLEGGPQVVRVPLSFNPMTWEALQMIRNFVLRARYEQRKSESDS